MEHMNVYETVMAMKHAAMVKLGNDADAHLERYITNRNRRTGNTWRVVKRYYTNGNGKRVASANTPFGYDRAVIENERGDRVRIYHRFTCWVMA